MNDVKLSRTYGPLSPVHIRMLQDPLDIVQSKYQIYADDDLLAKAQIREKNSAEASPQYHNQSPINLKEYLYIDVPLEDVLVVRSILVKLGFEQTPDLTTENTLMAEEFVCPRCDHLQLQPGYCPKHHLLLLPYFQKSKTFQNWKDYLIWLILVGFIFIFVAFIIYSNLAKH